MTIEDQTDGSDGAAFLMSKAAQDAGVLEEPVVAGDGQGVEAFVHPLTTLTVFTALCQ